MKFKKLFTITICLAMALTGCVQLPERTTRQVPETVTDYSATQMYLVLAGRKSEVSEVYTDKLFDVVINDSGATYNGTFNNMVKDYLEKIHVMTQMSEDRGIELSDEDTEEIAAKADAYMEAFRNSGNAYDVSEDDVIRIRSDLKKIDMLREQIVSESDIEVSESDARVMDVIRIELDDSEAAYSTLEEANTSDMDFETLARKNSVNSQISVQLSRGDLGDTAEEIVFGLEDGEISPVIPDGDKYYIYKCVNGYNEEATAENKEKILTERRKRAVGLEYEEYIAENPYTLNTETWNEAVKMCTANPEVPDVYKDY